MIESCLAAILRKDDDYSTIFFPCVIERELIHADCKA